MACARTPTEEDYYRHVVAQLEEDDNPLMDHVAGLAEWAKCRRALLRFIAEQDAQYDEIARNQEQGLEP
jgi:hypothetical protein